VYQSQALINRAPQVCCVYIVLYLGLQFDDKF